MILKNSFLTILFLMAGLLISPGIKAQEDVRKSLQSIIEQGIESKGVRVGNIYLNGYDTITKYYVQREFQPLWSDATNRAALLEIIEGAYEEGLLPEDYHLEAITTRMEMGDDIDALSEAELDLLMSDALILFIRHMNYGKVSQSKLREDWNIPSVPMPDNSVAMFLGALQRNQLKEQSGEYGPKHFMYTHLKRGLKKYRVIAEAGGWPAVPEGDVLKKGMTDERVAVMRKRLQITGDLGQDEPADPNLFDDELEQAV